MTRIRTHKTSKYFSLSNASAQDPNLSWEAIGFLAYCLSMPQDWEFHPKKIWKMGKCGRQKTYNIFNELIENYRCIRIRKPNPNAKNLPGEISYEIFDDIEDCKNAIIELEKTDNFIEHGGNLKKCFRQPCFEDTEIEDPENWNNTKEIQKTKEIRRQQQQGIPKNEISHSTNPNVVVVSSEEEILRQQIFKEFGVDEDMAKEFSNVPYLRIKNATLALEQAESKGKAKNRMGYLREAIRKGWIPTENKKEINPEEVQKEKISVIEKVKIKCSELRKIFEKMFTFKCKFEVRENCIELISPTGIAIVGFLEKTCIPSLTSFIKLHFQPNFIGQT